MRKRIYRTIFVLTILLSGFRVSAQIIPTRKDHEKKVDSFLHVLKIAKEDTNKVNTLEAYIEELFWWDADDRTKAMENIKIELSLSGSLNYQKGIGNAYIWMALSSTEQAKYEEALRYYADALKLREAQKDHRGIVTCYGGFAAIATIQKDYPKALTYFNVALKTAEDAGDKRAIAGVYEGLGQFYLHKDSPKYPESLKYYLMNLKIAEELDDKELIFGACNQIGILYMEFEDYSDALKYFLDIKKKTGEAAFLGNLLICYTELKNYTEAINAINAYIEKRQKQNLPDRVAYGMARAGQVYREMAEHLYSNKGNADTVTNYLNESLKNFEACKKIMKEEGLQQMYPSYKYDYGVIYKMKGELVQKKEGPVDTIRYNLNMALNYFLQQSNNRDDASFKYWVARCYVRSAEIVSMEAPLGPTRDASKKYLEAMKYLDSALLIAKETSDKQVAKEATWTMVEVYKKTENYDKALKTLKYYDELKDSISKEETDKKLEQMRIANETIVGATEEKARYERVISDLNFIYLKKEDSLKFQERLTDERFKQQQKEVQLKQAELALANKQNELNQLAYLKSQAELQSEQSQRKEKEKQLIISGQQQDLQKSQLKLQQAQLRLNENQLRSERRQTLFYAIGLILALVFFGFIYYNIRNRQKAKSIISAEKIKAEKANAARKMTELELQSLRTQLNPHFMFNSLNAIQELILKEDNENSHVYLSRFSELLRMLLDNATQPFISLRKELHFLELYLSLENLRIPDLQYSIEVDPKVDSEKTLIPNMMLQPYIENAIWHGLSHKKQDKKLRLKVRQTGDYILFEIKDNGVGRKKATELKSLYRQEHKSKGMELLSKRFSLLSKEYGTNIRTQVTDLTTNGEEVNGTLVEVSVPVSLTEKINQGIYDTSHYN